MIPEDRFARFLLLLFVISLSGCDRVGDKENRSVFRYNESAGITSLDPAFARNQANIWAVNQLFSGLVQLDSNLNVRPCISDSWRISEDGLVYTFHVRQDVYFHDDPVFPSGKGRKVKASDFVYSFLRLTDKDLASPGAWVFNMLAKDDKTGAIRAPDDSTLIIRLSAGFPPFLGILSMQYCSVVPREAIEAYGKDFRKHPVGTGPFRIKKWKEDVKLVLVRNEHYFEVEGGRRLPYLDAVSISFIVDKQSVFLEFVKGNLDFMSGLDASYKDELLSPSGRLNPKYADKIILTSQPYLNTEYLGILVDTAMDIVRTSPLKVKKVRQAINWGFDRRKMMRYLRNNVGLPGLYGMVPPGLPSFDSVQTGGYNYNPDKARQLLREAGFPNGQGMPEIVLSTNNSYLDLSTYIQQQLTELGIRIRLDVHQPASMREMVAQCKLNLFRASWIADYPDAENYLSLFYSGNFTPDGPNYTHFRNSRYDELYVMARETVDDSTRFHYYREMDRLLIEEAPVVVLYYDQVLRFTRRNVSGLGSNAMNLLDLKRVRKLKED